MNKYVSQHEQLQLSKQVFGWKKEDFLPVG